LDHELVPVHLPMLWITYQPYPAFDNLPGRLDRHSFGDYLEIRAIRVPIARMPACPLTQTRFCGN
jgi:hypothetical protein